MGPGSMPGLDRVRVELRGSNIEQTENLKRTSKKTVPSPHRATEPSRDAKADHRSGRPRSRPSPISRRERRRRRRRQWDARSQSSRVTAASRRPRCVRLKRTNLRVTRLSFNRSQQDVCSRYLQRLGSNLSRLQMILRLRFDCDRHPSRHSPANVQREKTAERRGLATGRAKGVGRRPHIVACRGRDNERIVTFLEWILT